MRGGDRAVLGVSRPPRGSRRVLRSRRVRAAALHRPFTVSPRAATDRVSSRRRAVSRHSAPAGAGAGRRLVQDLQIRAPREARRLLWIDSSDGKVPALEHHRASPLPTVLVSPSLREGVDLPDDFLRFQILTKLPFPDLGDPWTAAPPSRDPRWYATETAKALLQAYGRSCRHADDHGVTYVLDAQFPRFVQRYRVLLPDWFLDAAEPALRVTVPEGEGC